MRKSNTTPKSLGERSSRPLLSRILYEDRHLLAFDKEVGEIVQGDKSGDIPLQAALSLQLKEREKKTGNVYL